MSAPVRVEQIVVTTLESILQTLDREVPAAVDVHLVLDEASTHRRR